MQNMATTDGVAGDHRDDGFRQGADFFLQIEHVEARDAVLTDVAGVAADLLVAAGAKREIASTGENDGSDFRVLVGEVEGDEHFLHRERAERIAHFRAVDGDFGNAPFIRGFITDVLEFAHGGPHGGEFG